ncbi:P-loop containing nucleoside triphosphate hydrolase protein [Sodiomyces alkalinus F11]|uniref:P-loop containing nucleoside triphosphate hydrolase protein n=1 Tax=Sodiomyces alkalinus (strain CBS 110278 / VKM F-3762 / F11) TaxID=1314773 RepID=A0A3N2PWU3_SODAK|nr:P-loop containing nucleoside triphosphate hydrolase protein [Sodiomyces alkalinus F11]ROT38993.1 P-loop containing nucleoside triphosphate hydrolase protein [Sodiomyces alkalinus F11]
MSPGSLGSWSCSSYYCYSPSPVTHHSANLLPTQRIFTFAGPLEYALQAVGIFAAICSGAGIALQNLIFGQFITLITDFAMGLDSPDDFRNGAATLALYFVYLGIARFVLSYTYNTLLTYAAYRIVRNIRHAYLRAALSQEVAFFDFGVGGSIATQATSNGRLIQGGITEKLGLTFQGLSAFVTAFTIAFVVQWKLTLICLCIAPATIIVMGVIGSISAIYETKILEIFAEANSFAEGVLASARAVHAFEMRARLVAKFDKYLADAHKVGSKNSLLYGILFSAEYTIIYLGFALAFWQGINMMARGEITSAGDIFTVLLSVVIASISLTMLAPFLLDFTRAASSAAKLFCLIDRESSINPLDRSGERPSETTGHLEIENVTFAYPTRPGINVLDDFTLNVPAGKVTALVGQSGSGKSTIVGLIERWYNTKSGTIKLDGRPIEQLNLNWLRTNVRLVQQEPVLFDGSVFDNIRYGLTGTPLENASREEQMERVQEAAKMAFAHDFISELPQGYDTQIGERGGLLSGGQKQRVAIARSVVSQPKVLLLDEATSALDPHAESIVQQALDKASEGRTTIVIAHKLATIRKADNVVVMSKGRIVEQGTHESLIAQDGTYARLVRIQNLAVSQRDSSTDEEDDAQTGGDKEADADHDLTKPLTRYATSVQGRLESQKDRDNYDLHKQLGILPVVFRLFKETSDLGWAYFFVFGGVALGAAAFPGQAILLGSFMEVFAMTGSEMIREGEFYATMFIVLAAGCFIAYFSLGYASNIVAQQLNHTMRRRSLNDMLRQDLRFFDRPENNTGAMASRVDSNPQAILELMGYNIALICMGLLNLSACSILAIAYSWRLGLVVVCAGLPPLVGTGYLKVRADAKLDREVSDRHSTSASIASEAVNAIRTVSSLAIEESVLTRYTAELEHAVSGAKRPLVVMMIWFAFTQAIEYWFMALGFWYGCRLLSYGDVTMYAFMIAFLGVFLAGQACAQLFQFSTSITKGINAANYIFWLHQLEPTVRETAENRENGPKSGGPIALEDVHFSYPLRPDATVLRGVDLHIKKGQFVALVGASGCGKSTMVAMLERFYDPTTGTIRIDGSALTDLNPRLYRSIVSLVQQEPTLFQGTIRENVALGLADDATADNKAGEPSPASLSLDIPDSTIEAALRAANAWDFVSSLPEGMSTPAGSNGTQLSGGQRQRIAIARALVRNPRVLLLDEATSALDTESEKIVQGALAEAAKEGERITIAVAHRLSTIKDADVICVFYGGRIVEMGTHAELTAQGGMYRKMCEAQALD